MWDKHDTRLFSALGLFFMLISILGIFLSKIYNKQDIEVQSIIPPVYTVQYLEDTTTLICTQLIKENNITITSSWISCEDVNINNLIALGE